MAPTAMPTATRRPVAPTRCRSPMRGGCRCSRAACRACRCGMAGWYFASRACRCSASAWARCRAAWPTGSRPCTRRHACASRRPAAPPCRRRRRAARGPSRPGSRSSATSRSCTASATPRSASAPRPSAARRRCSCRAGCCSSTSRWPTSSPCWRRPTGGSRWPRMRWKRPRWRSRPPQRPGRTCWRRRSSTRSRRIRSCIPTASRPSHWPMRSNRVARPRRASSACWITCWHAWARMWPTSRLRSPRRSGTTPRAGSATSAGSCRRWRSSRTTGRAPSRSGRPRPGRSGTPATSRASSAGWRGCWASPISRGATSRSSATMPTTRSMPCRTRPTNTASGCATR